MKKFVAILLVAIMVISVFSASAFADSSETITQDKTLSIDSTVRTVVSNSGTVDANDDAAVINVTISWDNVDFVYKAETRWNPASLKYEKVDDESGWVNDTANITVANRSNCEIDASVSFNRAKGNSVYDGVTAGFNRESASIESAVEKTTPPSDTFTLTVSGTPNTVKSIEVEDFGTITVVITGHTSQSTSGTTTGGSNDGDDNDT